jgi:hypothetical protein
MSAGHPTEARATLDAAVRVQLAAAFERGKQAQRHWDNTGAEVLADAGAPGAFKAVAAQADEYAASLARFHRTMR